MRAERVRELLRVRPFAPFRLHLSDGKIFEVRHPELAAVDSREIWLYASSQTDWQVYCDTAHVVWAEVLEEEQAG